MKKDIVFIQQFPMPYFGILSMSAYLAKEGYAVDVLVDALEKNLIEKVKELNPQVIGFSVFSSEHLWLIDTARKIKEAFPGIALVVGGVHAMIYPENILEDTPCDFVCHSDGEGVVVDIVKELKKPQASWPLIKGIAYRDNEGKVFKNEAALHVPFRDDIVEDRNIYFNRYPILLKDEFAFFLSSRGCPYSCSFCYNAHLRDLAPNKQGYLRQKKESVLIDEIKRLIEKTPIKIISFIDDMFTFNKEWLKSFLALYKDEINLPFGCNTRADQVDEEMVSLLSQAGCKFASFGIETGNEDIRSRILNKHVKNQEIIRAGNLLSAKGITVRSSNMFCLPEETLEDAFKTVDLNIESKVASASSMLLLPYPKTKISDYCQEKNFFEKEFTLYDLPHITQRTSVLDIPDKRKIVNVHYLTYWFVRFPLAYRLFRGVVYAGWLNSILYPIFLLGFFVRNKNEGGLTWIGALRFAWRKRNLMIRKKSSTT